jgi:hypothetical protein
MKQTKKKIVWLVAFLVVGSIPVFAKPFAVGPYLGQTPPGPIPKVFAPGLICDTRPHHGDGLICDTRPHHGEGWVSFSADGNTFCFYRDFYVYITENTDQGWTRPEQIKSVPYMVTSPCLSPDANSIYFIPAKNNPRLKHRGLYRCDRTIHGWSEPQLLGPPVSSGPSRSYSDRQLVLWSGKRHALSQRIIISTSVPIARGGIEKAVYGSSLLWITPGLGP